MGTDTGKNENTKNKDTEEDFYSPSLLELHTSIAERFNQSIRKVKETFPEERYDEAAYYSKKGHRHGQDRAGGYGFGGILAIGSCFLFSISNDNFGSLGATAFAVGSLMFIANGINSHVKFRNLKQNLKEDMERATQGNKIENSKQHPPPPAPKAG